VRRATYKLCLHLVFIYKKKINCASILNPLRFQYSSSAEVFVSNAQKLPLCSTTDPNRRLPSYIQIHPCSDFWRSEHVKCSTSAEHLPSNSNSKGSKQRKREKRVTMSGETCKNPITFQRQPGLFLRLNSTMEQAKNNNWACNRGESQRHSAHVTSALQHLYQQLGQHYM
jgi:hypothetical protein